MEMACENKRGVFWLGGLLAALTFVVIFGWRVLIPTYDDWLLFSRDGVDNMQHYQGWVAYRGSAWHFPIGLIDGILYPEKISVIYTDSVPLFAFIFKLLSPVLPETFQYFGWFGLLCAFLIGGYASCFIYSFTGQRVYSVICSLFFSTSFVFLHRMFYHTALSAQWIVVAALYLWLVCPYDTYKRKEYYTYAAGEDGIGRVPMRSWQRDYDRAFCAGYNPGFDARRVTLWSLLSVTALLTEAYFLPMVWGIMTCDILQYSLKKSSEGGKENARTIAFIKEFFLTAIKCMLPAAVLTVLIGWVFGLFYGEVDATGLGLGVYTFNLINFINPFWMSSVIPWLPSDFFQYEGLAYLGIGVLCMIAVIAGFFIVEKYQGHRRRAEASEETKNAKGIEAVASKTAVHEREQKATFLIITESYRIIPLSVFIVGFGIAAASPTISLGDYRITVPIPEVLARLWSTFRSSGRLIWPVYYLIILSVCIALQKCISKLWGKRAATVILIMAFATQMYDAHGFIGGLHEKFATKQTYVSSLSDPRWEDIAEDYEHIMICPDTHAIYYTYEGEELERFALKHGLTMNIVYTARVVSSRVNKTAGEELDRIRAGEQPKENTVYVFLDGKCDESLGLFYYNIDGYMIGLARSL